MSKKRSIVFSWLILCLMLFTLTPAATIAQSDPKAVTPQKVFLPFISDGATTEVVAARQSNPNGLASSDVSLARQADVSQYWTQERLLNAKPLDLLNVSGKVAAAASQPEVAAAGSGGKASGGLPDADSLTLAQKLNPEAWKPSTATIVDEAPLLESQGWSSAPPFTSYYVNLNTPLWKIYPHHTIGRLFFTIPGQGNFSCTASVAIGRAVWTAGHCVYTPGVGWNTNVVFIPGYRAGVAPYGSFNAFSLITLNGWISNDIKYDIGMLAVSDIKKKKVSQWVGWLGFIYDASPTQLFVNFGYPGNLGNNGNYSIACASQTSDLWTQDGAPQPKGMGCDMTFGASGGPWLVAYTPFVSGAVNYVNGVNSFISSGFPNRIFSAHFSTGAKNLYDWGVTQ